jgi:hypothetical protein|tara:strand:- start:289 stop:471 length:183 start_codon:yes stop_codon:yes gene_type:complete
MYTKKQEAVISKRLDELINLKEKLPNLVQDLFWEYDRMSSSGQETLDKIADVIGIPKETI